MLRFLVLSVVLLVVNGAVLPLRSKPFQPKVGGRIVGGHDADIVDFPYQASVQNFGAHRCGGSIISARTIVSSVRCVRQTQNQFLTIRTGSSLHDQGGTVSSVARVIQHEDYNIPHAFNHDISLIFLVEPLVFGTGVQPVAIPVQNFLVTTGHIGNLTGWGLPDENSPRGEVLQTVEIPVLDHDQCIADYSSFHDIEVTVTMLCAGYDEGGVDACDGDQGGPLVIHGELQGVASWGAGCAEPESPGVYTRAAFYHDWIRLNEI